MLFAGEICQSAENKKSLFNIRLLFLDSVRILLRTDDPYVIYKLKSEPHSAGLKADYNLLHYNTLNADCVLCNCSARPCCQIGFKGFSVFIQER